MLETIQGRRFWRATMASDPTDPTAGNSMPTATTRDLFIWAAGFGTGALVVTLALVFVVGFFHVGHFS
jgi:hypothetical protein